MRLFFTRGSLLAASLLIAACQTTPLTTAELTNRATLHNLSGNTSAPKITVEQSAQIYQVNDPIRFRVTSEQAGRLWIIQVDPRDQASVVYPTSTQVDNRISAGKPTDLPNAAWATELRAAEPAGVSRLAFIVTPESQRLEDIVTIRNGKLIRTAFASDKQWSIHKMPLDVRR